MPSSLIVPVAQLTEVKTHPNADALEIAEVLGWQCVVPKGKYKKGDTVVYFPPDTILPQDVSDGFGVTKYLSKGRIRCARLRGEPSFGLVVEPPADQHWEIGTNVGDYYRAAKYEPPPRPLTGDQEKDDPMFPCYTDIENMRHFPEVLTTEEVVATEKVHGTNSRVGMVQGVRMAGTHKTRRKEPEDYKGHIYWSPWGLSGVRSLLESLAVQHQQVVLFGEVFGRSIQSLDYGCPKGTFGYRAFDLMLDGRYQDYEVFSKLCNQFEVQMVPLLYRGPFSLDRVRELSKGKTTLGADHIREGVVVKPLVEKTDPKIGRVILKYVSDDYLLAGDKISDTKDI